MGSGQTQIVANEIRQQQARFDDPPVVFTVHHGAYRNEFLEH
jgi:hypothetical protein